MKAVVLCVFFLAAAWAVPTCQNEAQYKRLYVDPTTDKLPSDIISRITHGVEAAPHSIPYQAYLIVTDVTGQRWLCGGSLISPRHILTAGHCIDNSVLAQVWLGAHNIQQPESSRILVESENLIPHEGYEEATISNDIGLIVLDEPVELNEYIDVVPLPRRETIDDYEGANARASGWGLVAGDGSTSPVLLEVHTTVISNLLCSLVYSVVTDSHICTSGTGGVGTCRGDSGGPLVSHNTLIGIVSYGARDCPAGYPSGYTRVTSYLDWIEEKSGLRF